MAARSFWRRITVLLLLTLAGCAGVNPYRSPAPGPTPVVVTETAPVQVPQPAPVPVPAAPPVAPQPGGAAAYLMADAERLANEGDYERAAAQVERALRIERGNPWLYLALADIRYAQGETAAAQVLLDKARSLANGDPQVAEMARVLSVGGSRQASPP